MTWTLLSDDNFTHADTSTGGAGSTTGWPNLPWTDKHGSVGSIVSNKGHAVVANNLFTDIMQTPDTAQQDARIVATFTHSASQHCAVVLRRQSGGNAYYCYTNGGTAIIAKNVSGSLTTIGSRSYTPTTGQPITFDFSVTGTSPTTLNITTTDPNNGPLSAGPFTDSESTLQTTGAYGIVAYTDTTDWTHVQTYTVASSSFTANPNVISTNGSGIVVTLTGTGTTWTGSPFSISSGPSGTSITAQNVASGTSATVTFTTGATAGTVVLSDGVTTTNITVSAGAVSIAAPVIYQTFQRSGASAGLGGTANVAVSGSYTGNPANVEYSTNGGTTWTTGASGVTGGTYSFTITGLAAGQYTLSVRFSADHSVTASTTYVGVGDVVACYGQSNMSGRGTSNQSYVTATGLKATLYGNDYAWKDLVDPYDSSSGQVDTVSSDGSAAGSFLPLLASQWMAYTRCPVSFVPCALGGTSITGFKSGGSGHDDRTTLYGSMHHRLLTGDGSGGVAVVLWWQGETDAAADMSAATYLGHFQTLSADIFADLACEIMPCKLQQSPALTLLQTSRINTAIGNAWTGDTSTLTGPDLSDITAAAPVGDDSYHIISSAGLQVVASRWWDATLVSLFRVGGGLASPVLGCGFIRGIP